jgi:ribosomal protein S18 acetylase RimI-like enzyme
MKIIEHQRIWETITETSYILMDKVMIKASAQVEKGDDYQRIYSFYVNPDQRGKKLGDKLLNHILNKIGGERICLTVAKDNVTAINLYTKYGFTMEGCEEYEVEEEKLIWMIRNEN